MTNEVLRIEKVMDHNDEAKAKEIVAKLTQEYPFREYFYDANTMRIYSRQRKLHEIRYERKRGKKTETVTETISDSITTQNMLDYIEAQMIAFMASTEEPCKIYINNVLMFSREVSQE